jgi:23S rRNA pseudouridine2605 synthase
MNENERENPDDELVPHIEPVRLNKFLADCGVASRRHADRLIVDGKVTVDGEICTELGVRVDPEAQDVEVSGVILRPKHARKRYYLLNKPAGVLCTNESREARPRAIDLITDRDKGRIYTVGRLDEDTVGIVILTNDGEFANRVMHPRYGVTKTYSVKLRGRVGDNDLNRIRDGVYLAEGRTAGARVLVKRRTQNQTLLWVSLQEGKNREVRRMFARLGHNVTHLRRIRIGTITDRGLKVGRWRPLTRAEVHDLLETATGEEPAPPRQRGGRRRPQGRREHGGRRAGEPRGVDRGARPGRGRR